MSHVLKALLLGCSLFILACGHLLTPAELDTQGSKKFAGNKDAVYGATVNALVDQGYEIALMNPETGAVKTHRRFTGAAAYYRLYLVRVEESGPGAVTVRAEPRVFQGADDISGKKIWNMDYENKLWGQLFKAIQDNLDTGLTNLQATPTAGPVTQ